MGAASKKEPPLPAPTETDTTTASEVATDISRPGDEKSSYSIPEDGTPVTIRTRGHKASRSQTSLLIEYFEGGKPGGSPSATDRKPSVRVRLTPSKKSRGNHIQVTETKGTRKASLTRRIPLDEAIAARDIELHEGEDAHSMTSYASATEESNVSKNPIDIEIDRSHRRRRPASPLIPSAEPYQPGNPSEISAIATDSFLDGTGPTGDVKRTESPSRGEGLLGGAVAGALAGAAMGEISNNKTRGKERVKITEKTKDKSDRKRHSKGRTSSSGDYVAEDARSPRRRSSRGQQESNISAADSSVLSSRSLDRSSMRSGTSKSSINNPKLLETVEDAIRRLILPELSALKREQSKRESRRGSLTSTGTSVSREEVTSERRRSSGGHRGETVKEGAKHKERRNREARHEYDEESLRSPSRGSLQGDGEPTTPKRSHNLLKAAAAGAAGAALAKGVTSAMADDDVSKSPDRRQRDRRRRRAEVSGPRTFGHDHYVDDFEEEADMPAPPMPLMSDINPSELTRTSILSAESDRPHSATEELVSTRGLHVEQTSGASTPIRRKEIEQHTIPMQHANVSHGDLTSLPRGNREFVEEYETDEFGQKIPIGRYYDYENGRDGTHAAEYAQDDYEERYYSTQDVPAPLNYVPYQAGARGLSPIPSVSGYTEGGSEAPLPQNSMEMPSPGKSPARPRGHLSVKSNDSVPVGGPLDRDFEQEESADGREHQYDETAGGHAVRGIGANPNIVHPVTGVESAVASLVDGSMLEQSVLTGGSGQRDYEVGRDSMVSFDEELSQPYDAREVSPEPMDIDEDRRTTPGSRSLAQSHDYSEKELDEYGRKVPKARQRHSPSASEAAITAGAVGAAAAALKAAKERRQATADSGYVDFQPAGVARNRSFKERTMQHGWEPRSTPTHSIDSFEAEEQPKMGVSGVPDMNDPMPEIGYVDDELRTNPSVVEGRLDGGLPADREWSGRVTPTPTDPEGYGVVDETAAGTRADHAGGKGLGITEAVGAAALGAAVGMAATREHTKTPDQDDWRRTSDERKRDTLITNPYEDASPIADPELDNDLLGARGLEAPFDAASPRVPYGQEFEEPYMSDPPSRAANAQTKGKGVNFGTDAGPDEDPFYTRAPKGHDRHLSGMSQGMQSPFYDASTGNGIERIDNKDIVALMQHLMVRDAQRSARDTEIVALLMNSALEMRNSFREMKELVQDTSDDVIFANVENTEKLQKSINGPRPYPGTAPRSLQSPSQAGTLEEMAAKKKNIWKRALQGLGAKGTNDLTRIEDMLMQLLGEVDVLKTQTAPPVSTGGPGRSLEDIQPEEQYEKDSGYEPEANSAVNRSNQPGGSSSQQTQQQISRASASDHAYSGHRISTVPEIEEDDYDDIPSPSNERSAGYLQAPTEAEHIQRGGSVPLDTPPRLAPPIEQQPLSAENTPRTEKGKRHKSSSSSGWLPKISRWSGTTASSVGKAFRNSGTSKKGSKYDEFQPPPSRSGSSLASYEDNYRVDPYGDDKLHSGFSDPSLAAQAAEPRTTQAPVGNMHMTPEDPKYKAHRNSLNLQHPQPRAGQTERFRTALEYSAQEYTGKPMTPRSAEWAGSATSLDRLPRNANRFSNSSSVPGPVDEYNSPPSQHSGPPRPPKEPIDSPDGQRLGKSSRVSNLQSGSPGPQQSSESGYGTMTGTYASHFSGSSPRLQNRNFNAALSVPNRKPSGPRAMTPKSPETDAAREERRRKRDTFGTVASEDTDTF